MGAFGEFMKSATGGGLVSGALNGIFGLIGQGQQHRNAMKQMDTQQEHALAQMAQSQEYNLANMEQQNQYQIDAENRANQWNSIGAQVDRARAAGVSPLAALGSGGAGGMMSVSSAPSSSTPSPAGASAVGSIGAGSLGLNLGANALQDAQIKSENASANASNALADKYNSEVTLNNQRVEEIKQSINESKQRVANMEIENTILGFQKTILGNQADSSEAVSLSTIAKSQYEVWYYSEVRDGRTPAQRDADAQYEYYFARAALDNANAANIKLLTKMTKYLEKYTVGAEITRLNRVMLENTSAMPFLQQLRQTPPDKVAEFVNANIDSAINEAKIVANKAKISEKDVNWYTANAILHQFEGYTGVAKTVSDIALDWIAASLTGGGSTVISSTVNKNGKGQVTGTSETTTTTTKTK